MPRSSRQRAERRKAGLCTECGKPPEVGLSRCRKCIDKANNRFRKLLHKNAAVGKCRCGKDKAPGLSRCSVCHAKHLRDSINRKRRLSDAGKCRCGRDKDPAEYRCPTCQVLNRVHTKRIRTKRKEEGKCPYCGRILMMGETVTCRICNEKGGDTNFTWN